MNAKTLTSTKDYNLSHDHLNRINQKMDKVNLRLLNFIKPKDNNQSNTIDALKLISIALQDLLTKTDIYLDKIERHAENIKKYNFKTSYGKANNSIPISATPTDKVDNSIDTPFIPIIKSKPNSLTPLPKEILSVHNDPVSFISTVDSSYAFPHPYEHEINNQPLKDFESLIQTLYSVQEIDKRQEHKFEFIETKEQLLNLCQEIAQHNFVSIDTEYHSEHSFQGYTCLIQVILLDFDSN